jgi:phage repressor protein C with HTH and peptisase S24 domain
MLTTSAGEYILIEAQFPGRPAEAIGVFLLDRDSNRAYIRLRRDVESLAEDDLDIEFLTRLAADLQAKANENGAAAFLAWLLDNTSNTIRVTDAERVLVDSFDTTLERLYRKYVTAKVLEFRTHLPRYTARAAAGRFGEAMDVEPEGWEEVSDDVRLTEDMFVAHVVGRSMLPLIPDGSLCIFKGTVTGTRQGKLVLVVNYDAAGDSFTIKRYRSIKQRDSGSDDEAAWSHARIILEPLNPEYEAWEVTPDSNIKVIGEFVRVLRVGD